LLSREEGDKVDRNSDSARVEAGASRERILAAAHEVLAARGERAEVREVAARAGVGVGTLYRHFGDRGGLVAAALAEASRRMLERVRTAAAEAHARTALRAVLKVLAEEHGRSGAVFALARAEGLPPDSSVAADLREVREAVIEVFEQGRVLGTFRADLDPEVATGVLMASLDLLAGGNTGRHTAVADLLLDGAGPHR
jgi:AcrR family transcriptional regulator